MRFYVINDLKKSSFIISTRKQQTVFIGITQHCSIRHATSYDI